MGRVECRGGEWEIKRDGVTGETVLRRCGTLIAGREAFRMILKISQNLIFKLKNFKLTNNFLLIFFNRDSLSFLPLIIINFL